VYDEFIEGLAKRTAELRIGLPQDESTDLGPMISAGQRQTSLDYIGIGVEEGARLVTGGEIPAEPPGGFYLEPAILADVDNAWRVAQEEIFGPVVTVIPFEDEKDAIRIANDVRYGLMATVWTGDAGRGHRVASRIKAGTVGINMPYTAFPGIPFGGYKQSGFGRELGIDTLELYLETKSILVSTSPKPINPFGL
jgi:acyl-CoA reductase-like NAD-dependent aldehyde dehydrogenase